MSTPDQPSRAETPTQRTDKEALRYWTKYEASEHGFVSYARQIATELTAALAEVERLREDRERLQWLCDNRGAFEWMNHDNYLRYEIDKAISSARNQPTP